MNMMSEKNVAEGKGFEPLLPLGKHAFQACALDHSATLPFNFLSL